jgi:hypothetical protein
MFLTPPKTKTAQLKGKTGFKFVTKAWCNKKISRIFASIVQGTGESKKQDEKEELLSIYKTSSDVRRVGEGGGG